MGTGLRRTDLQALALADQSDAELLLKQKRFSNAYHIAGYAVEIGLKACIAKQVAPATIPDKDLMKNFFVHDFVQLVGLAGLKEELAAELKEISNFAANWALVGEWSPESRYQAWDPTSAQYMVSAISHPTFGVMQWIKKYW